MFGEISENRMGEFGKMERRDVLRLPEPEPISRIGPGGREEMELRGFRRGAAAFFCMWAFSS